MNYGYDTLRITWWAKWATGLSVLAVFLHIFIFDRLPWLKDFIIGCISIIIIYKFYYLS